MKGTRLYLTLWAALTFGVARPAIAQNAMDKILFHDVVSPFGDIFHIALMEPNDAKALYKEVGGKIVTEELGHPKLRKAYQLTNGWILYNQYVTGEWLIYTDRTIFQEILDASFDPGMGIEFNSSGKKIEFYYYILNKGEAIERILKSSDWVEIPSLEDYARVYRNEKGHILELTLPHLDSGVWMESIEHYERRVESNFSD